MAFSRGFSGQRVFGACLIAAAVELGGTGCSVSSTDADDDSSGSGGSSSGGTGGSGGNSTPSCGQACQDFLVSFGLNDTIWFLWNQRIAGRPSGTKDETGPCPLGGTAHITGTTTVSDNGIDIVDIAFAFESCENADDVYELSYTGSVTMQGSFDGSSELLALTFDSPALVTSGTLHYYDDPVIDESCPVSFAQDGSGEATTYIGKVCGRSFNSETALPTASNPSGGSGGSSSTGGTGGSGASGGVGGGGNGCQCFCPNGSDCTGASTPNPCGVDADGIPEPCGCPVGCQ